MGTHGEYPKHVFVIAAIYRVLVLLPQWVCRGGLDLTGSIVYDSNRYQAVQTIDASRCPRGALIRPGRGHTLRQ